MARRPSSVSWLGVLVAAVLVCAGCSDSESKEPTSSARESTEPSATPDPTEATSSAPEPTDATSQSAPSGAKGTTITGSGYSYQVPEGWGVPPQSIPGMDPDSLAADLQDDDEFVDNVNVLLSPAGLSSPEQAEESAKNELTAVGAKEISVLDRVTVAGTEAAHVTALLSLNDREYRIEQFYVNSTDQSYVVTFSFSTSLTAGDRARVTGPVLASWTWTD